MHALGCQERSQEDNSSSSTAGLPRATAGVWRIRLDDLQGDRLSSQSLGGVQSTIQQHSFAPLSRCCRLPAAARPRKHRSVRCVTVRHAASENVKFGSHMIMSESLEFMVVKTLHPKNQGSNAKAIARGGSTSVSWSALYHPAHGELPKCLARPSSMAMVAPNREDFL